MKKARRQPAEPVTLAIITRKGQPYRRLESRAPSPMVHVVNTVNECNWGNYRGLYRALAVETTAITFIEEVRIQLGAGVGIDQVPENLRPLVVREVEEV